MIGKPRPCRAPMLLSIESECRPKSNSDPGLSVFRKSNPSANTTLSGPRLFLPISSIQAEQNTQTSSRSGKGEPQPDLKKYDIESGSEGTDSNLTLTPAEMPKRSRAPPHPYQSLNVTDAIPLMVSISGPSLLVIPVPRSSPFHCTRYNERLPAVERRWGEGGPAAAPSQLSTPVSAIQEQFCILQASKQGLAATVKQSSRHIPLTSLHRLGGAPGPLAVCR